MKIDDKKDLEVFRKNLDLIIKTFAKIVNEEPTEKIKVSVTKKQKEIIDYFLNDSEYFFDINYMTQSQKNICTRLYNKGLLFHGYRSETRTGRLIPKTFIFNLKYWQAEFTVK